MACDLLTLVDTFVRCPYNQNRRFQTDGFDKDTREAAGETSRVGREETERRGGDRAARQGEATEGVRALAKRDEDATERLLAAAREEFFEKGYEAASLCAIAERAGSSKGAIYVRYPDKAALYEAVVGPVIEELYARMERCFDDFGQMDPAMQRTEMNAYADRGIGWMVDFLYDHFAEFKILVCGGKEDLYQRFMHRMVELDSATTYRYIEAVGNDAVTSGRLTPEIMHMINTACFTGIFEVVAHDMGREEAHAYVERLCLFYRAGWNTIFYPDYDVSAGVPKPPSDPAAAHELKRLVEARGGSP